VAGFAAVAEALGDRFTADVIDGRREDAPDDWMLSLIPQADVFQLFWSTHSMQSASCRRQWEAALATGRPGFIRPLYWEQPFPRAPGLPPPSLDGLRFIRVPVWEERATTEQLWRRVPPSPAAAQPPREDHRSATGSVPPPSARRAGAGAGAGAGALGVAGVFGLVVAVAAAVVTSSLSGGPTGPDVSPPLPPDGGGGPSPLVVVAVAVGAFVVAFALALAVLRRRRATGSRRRRRTASSGR
jgi:hypothetical protein